MMKRALAAICLMMLFLSPGTASASALEDILPNDTKQFVRFSYSEKSSSLISWLMSSFAYGNANLALRESNIFEEFKDSNEHKTPFINVLWNALQDGKPVSLVVDDDLLVFPVDDEEFEELIADVEKTIYRDTPIYNQSDITFSKIDNFLVGADGNADNLKKIIDTVTSGTSSHLTDNTAYQSVAASFYQPSIFDFFRSAATALEDDVVQRYRATTETFVTALFGVAESMVEAEGVSVAENPDGYSFRIVVQGDAQKMEENNFIFNSGGDFTPTLFQKFPNAKPLLYAESFDLKQRIKDSGNGVYKEMWEELEGIAKATGVDVKLILQLFDQEVGFAIQWDVNSRIPYFTLLGNVQNNRDTAEDLMAHLPDDSMKLLEELKVKDASLEKNPNGLLAKITIPSSSWGESVLTLGITEDNMFVISNFPNAERASARTGFADDNDFSRFPEIRSPLSGLVYFSMRKTLDWLTHTVNSRPNPSFELQRDYYAILQKLYFWKDLLITTKNEPYKAVLTGKFVSDVAQPKTYAEFIRNAKASDTDGDGVSDFAEKYSYQSMGSSTPTAQEPPSFKDVPSTKPYASAVQFLAQKGIVRGYANGTYKPNKAMSRAEFVAMLVNTFEMYDRDPSKWLPLWAKNSPLPFSDVDIKAWYALPLAKAYYKGILWSTGGDGYKFRPKKPITRSEAVYVLSHLLPDLTGNAKKYPPPACDPAPFTDIKPANPFCRDIMKAHANNVVRKTKDNRFRPNVPLTRGTAALLIVRALEADVRFRTTTLPDFDRGFSGLADELF